MKCSGFPEADPVEPPKKTTKDNHLVSDLSYFYLKTVSHPNTLFSQKL